MSFLTPALTAGAVLIALPIILHLVMRRQPTPLVFPALRFLEKRRSSNQTRLKLRHWVLLALRCAAIGLLAFALARPALRPSGGGASETGLVSVALVFDNSPRLEYREKNQTRLEAAQELGGWLLERLPGDSRVAVVATGGARGKRLVERDAASLRVERLGVSHRARRLEEAVADAVDLLAEREGDLRELYVFTDLAATAWPVSTRQAIAEQLDRVEGVTLFVVDVGGEQTTNRGLGPLELSSSSLTLGQPFSVEAEVYSSAGAAEKPVVAELWIEAAGGARKRAETLVTPGGAGPNSAGPNSEGPGGGGPPMATFTLPSLDEAIHQGYVRIADADPLEADNVRYFTVEVTSPRPVLLVGGDRAATLFVDQALAPPEVVGGELNAYETKRITFADLGAARLAEFDSVWLLDPPPLGDRLWRRLDDYARGGGAVAVALGRRAKSGPLNEPAPQALLAGPLKWKSRDATYLRPRRYDHPALDQLADFAAAIPWAQFPVFEYWLLAPAPGQSLVIAPFANGDPAIIERTVGDGRVLTITTPLSDPASDSPWNLLPTGPDPWPFLALTKNLADDLSGAAERRWNYAAGDPAVVPAPPGAARGGYVLRLPTGESIKTSQPGATEIVIGATDTPGNYRVLAGGERGRLDTGFSVNTGDDVGRLERLPFGDLQSSLGAARTRLARGRSELERQVDVGRVGRELYPWLIALVALSLGAEHLVSNRFYGEA